MTTCRSFLASFLCSALSVSVAHAGHHDNWSTIPVPADLQGNPNVIGTSITFQTTNHVHLWSGITKRWTQLPIVSGISFFEQYNDYVVIRDGNRIHAWSTREDIVRTLDVSPSAVIKSGPVTSSWVTLVVDGTQAWGFSAFRGGWFPLTLSQPNPTLFASRITALIRDGSTIHAFSAFHDSFVSTVADPSVAPQIGGEIGLASSPGTFRGYSPHQHVWTVVPFAGAAGSVAKNGFGYAVDGATMLAYSSYTGAATTLVASAPITGIQSADDVLAFNDGNTAVCYAAGSGSFATRNAPTASFQFGLHFLIVTEPGAATPFSGLTGGFGATLAGTHSIATHDVVAYAYDGATLHGYSAMTNTWAQAPSAAFSTPPVMVKGSLVVPYSSGYEAMSARYGQWIPLASSLANAYLAPTNGANFIAFTDANGTSLAMFDSRLDRFNPLSGNAALTVKTSRHTAIAHDGGHAYGFGQPTGRWDAIELHAPVAVHDVASEAGYVMTDTELHTYSSQGSLSYEGRFPEFTRILPLGNTLWLHQVGEPNSAIVTLLGLAPAWLPVSALQGTLFIDPTFLITLPLPVTIPADGILHLPIAVPQDPVLSGIGVHLQNAVLPPSGGYYLSSSVAPAIF